MHRAVVVAQLAKRSLPTQEDLTAALLSQHCCSIQRSKPKLRLYNLIQQTQPKTVIPMPIEINLAVKNSVTLMPDNFVLSMPACSNTKKLPSFCAGTAESQLRQNRQFIGFASSQNVLVLRILAWTNLRENILSELPDHRVILVVRVIGVSKFSIRTKLKLEEFMTEFALVSDVVTQIEVVAHGGDAGVRFLISYQALSKIKIRAGTGLGSSLKARA